MELNFTKCHGSGNDFILLNASEIDLDDASWGRIARALSDRDGPVGADGILLLTQGDRSSDFGFRVVNADGSEPETCLNGLRCVARAGFEVLGLDAARVRLKTSGAQVAREAELAPGVYTVRETVGPVATDPAAVGIRVAGPVIEAVVPELPSDRAFTALAMPNPHLIAFVERVDVEELVALGNWCEAGPELLVDRANVSFVEVRGCDLFVQTFERGVGLTHACGSAMAASAHAAGLTGRLPFAEWLTVFNPGGRVRARAEGPAGDDAVTIAGNATFEWDGVIEIDPATGAAGPVRVVRRREDEVAAWEAARG
ncbi:diaminopimelate epimerase [Sphingomonas sp.]|uniref:diaminopimelate epimerase n=1 Tax=Sphingomonas sp. TaxID=28214 RepID=UPI00185C8EB0|nr:diaminopimelate epimerase [Sphingomonas sp.]MBA4761864.1 diaminopimelate epimerase [Sphingomonas sp.]